MKELRERDIIPMKVVKKGSLKERDKLLDLLMALDDPEKINNEVREYWKTRWQNTERDRFSIESKRAYNDLRKILKYYLFGKKDSAIIQEVWSDKGELITEKNEVEKELARTLTEIQVDESWGRIAKQPFPKLSRLNEDDMENVLSLLSNGKAMGFDGITDALFRKERAIITAAEIASPLFFCINLQKKS